MNLQEIREEFSDLFWKRQKVLDVILPPAFFAILQSFLSLPTAIVGAFLVALIITSFRLRTGSRVMYALGGIAGVVISVASVVIFDDAKNYFLPSLIKNIGIAVGVAVTLIFKYPITALSSHLFRGWPLAWYAHPNVRPAYFEVALLWVAFFGLRAILQYNLFLQGGVEALTGFSLLTGFPAVGALLIASYIYGVWRLKRLAGPSVQEWKQNTPPPWQSQQRGF